MTDWLKQSAVEQGRAIGAGRLDPRDLVEGYLDAAGTELGARIYARLTPERAQAEAAAAAERARLGVRRGGLDGVPVSWKDLFDSAGVATEAGSALLAGRVPERDAAVLARASAAGLVCLGKTHMTELAFSGLGLNPVTATPPCINDPDAAPGGSSSGAAASVAFGMAAAGIGSDTGGSVRLPSVWNDLVGFKTAHGSLPIDGVVPLCPRFDTLGPLCRTVEDVAALWSVLAARPAPDLRQAGLAGRRFLVLGGVAQQDLEPAVAQSFSGALQALEAAGATLVEETLTCVEEALPLSATLFAPEAYGIWKDVIEASPDKMFAEIRERFRGGRDVSAADFVAAWARLDGLRADYAERTAGFDAVLLPTCPILPPNRARLETDGAYYRDRNLMTLRNTRIGNLMGLAAVTLPTGVPSTGLTLQTVPGREGLLLRLAAAAEAALGTRVTGEM
ncbi:amidase [Palleronia caenipelagi]|uniref:Amidase n=1 Tax=Palleronia caenipelagi TaxID=2489174 RepID=A0A547Q0L8_9RHOB|nr:amidase family protein [Palleronia caenipelagi]TRD19848.1 amidase [Palleronia caenipelagi]